mmetsp:Transcript_94712/g.276998  ORF Transcript_94712/g.276998 Transcript_94712/m.276998 type:complete len:499 (+) Transcript_94712:62-1558(+)
MKSCIAAFITFCHSRFAVVHGTFEDAPKMPGNFSFDVDHTHTFCDLDLNSGKGLSKNGALAGLNISVVMHLDMGDVMLRTDSEGRAVGGFLFSVFNELAKRGGFSWHLYLVPKGAFRRYETWTQFVQAIVKNYDIFLAPVMITPERYRVGLSFGFPLVDASPVFVTQVKNIPPTWTQIFFNFLRPFSNGTWMALLATFVVMALAYLFIEWSEADIEDYTTKPQTAFAHALFLSAGAFTGGASFTPGTRPGKLLIVAWSFTVLVLTSGYTAKLASMLVSNGQRRSPVASVEEAVQEGLGICVPRGSMEETILRNMYPTALTQGFPGHDTFLKHGLRGMPCIGQLIARYSWINEARGHSKHNPGCEMDLVGQPLMRVDASFTSLSALGDSKLRCAHRMVYFMNSIMLEIYMEDLIQETMKLETEKRSDQTCASTSRHTDDEALSLCDTGGIFLVFAITTLLIVAWRRCSFASGAGNKDAQEEDCNDEDDSSQSADSLLVQ